MLMNMMVMILKMETVWAWHVTGGRVRGDGGVDFDEYDGDDFQNGNDFENGNCLGLARYMGTCQRPKRQEVAKERATALQRRSRPFCSIFPTSCIHS